MFVLVHTFLLNLYSVYRLSSENCSQPKPPPPGALGGVVTVFTLV